MRKIHLIIPMENVRASQTPEALARDEKMKQEFMNKVGKAALREFVEKWRSER